ncbi:hypothetical protein ACRAWD_30815 [Caulobacter segnis]
MSITLRLGAVPVAPDASGWPGLGRAGGRSPHARSSAGDPAHPCRPLRQPDAQKPVRSALHRAADGAGRPEGHGRAGDSKAG